MDETQTSRDEDFSPGFSSVQQERSEPEPSRVSARTDRSMPHPIDFKNDDTQTDLSFSDCGVTEKDCAALTSVLRSNPSQLRELNLNNKKLQDSGVKLLSVVLEDPDCKLEKLWLVYCGVTDEGCAALASALRSNPSHVRQLNLYGNKLGDSYVKLLSDLNNDPRYKLETLDHN